MSDTLYPTVHRGDLFYVNIGATVGSEQNGCRPALVIQNDIGNIYSPTIIVALLTTQMRKRDMPTHILLGRKYGLAEKSVVMFEQIATLDRQRFRGYIGTLDKSAMSAAEKAIRVSLGLH